MTYYSRTNKRVEVDRIGKLPGEKGWNPKNVGYFLTRKAVLLPMAFGDHRVELGGWTWDRSEAVGTKAPTGPPVIRLDKKLIKTTRCSSVRYDVNLLLVGVLGGGICRWTDGRYRAALR